jgi:hypothetical protein
MLIDKPYRYVNKRIQNKYLYGHNPITDPINQNVQNPYIAKEIE